MGGTRCNRRRLLAGAAGSVPAAALAACGHQAEQAKTQAPNMDQPVSTMFWHTQTGPNAKALQRLVDKFNSETDKPTTVVPEYIGGYTHLYHRLIAAVQAGQPPDVASTHDGMMADIVRADAVAPLDDYALRGPIALRQRGLDDLFPACLQSNGFPQYGNRLLGFPFTKSLLVSYVDLELLDAAGVMQAPRTWDEFERAAKSVARRGADGRPSVFGWGVPVNASAFHAWVLSRGGELLSPDVKRVRFGEAAGIESLELLERTARAGLSYQPKGFEYQNDFGVRKVAMLHESSTVRPYVREALAEAGNAALKWWITQVPQRAASRHPVTVLFGANFSLFRSAPLRQAAGWEWIKFFTETEQTAAWAADSSFMPVRRSAAASPALKAHWERDIQGKQAFDLMPYARSEPNIAAWPDIRSLLEAAIVDVVRGKKSAKPLLKDAAREAQELLAATR